MLTEEQRREAADRLRDAELDRAPIPPLTESLPGIDAVDAYEIQLINIRRRLAAGAVVRGHKVGLSSRAMQQMMGVDEPDYGHLLADMELRSDEPVEAARYCYPRVEVEVGFVLGADLPGEDCTEDDVLQATERVVPALELIDSRIADWRIRLADTIADNASSAGYVIGEGRPPEGLDLTAIEASLYRDGEHVVSGRSDAVLGDPVTAVAWLARKVASFGVRLRAGHLVLPGSCTRAIDVAAGQTFTADFTDLGSVSLTFK
ncbi:2-keto-4-pentenoate hydratase [Thermomonospora cellulosilytica]|uniref:2-keto-4-pentenoate hydratase n=1 Tax=Thermomonospora cellulosilytica TaxID=1411118 RepID=A0A7W3N482_9ACTN|nr:2-keto-4-pentenoate hydratase [Thermomonospora cellulosilytica]MBA9007173.1 2-keto-4-pentenoate hydratase [Thermomonospora cellulosilytica]